MGKFVFVFALALIALQGSVAYQPSLRSEDAAGSNAGELIEELNKLIHDTTTRFAELYAQMKDKVVEIENEIDLPVLMNDFTQEVMQMMTQDGAENCKTLALEQISEVNKMSERFFFCKIEINDDMAEFKKQTEVLASKVGELLKEIGSDVYKCMEENQGSFDKFGKCMEQKIENIKQKLQVVEKEIQETFNVIEQSIPMFTDKISACYDNKKKELMDKMQVAKDNIKTCLPGNNVAPAHLKMANSNVQELIEELKKLIRDTISRFAELYAQMKDKVVAIENEINLPVLMNDFTQEVLQMMTQDGAENCRNVALEQIAEVNKISERFFFCKIEITNDMVEFKKQMEVLASKVGDLLKEIGSNVNKCMGESQGSFDKFSKCMEESIENIKQKLQVVEKEIQETLNVIEQSIPIFVNQISACYDNNKKELTNKMQIAKDNIKTCLAGNNVAPAHLKMANSNVQELVEELEKLIRDTTSRFVNLFAEMKQKIEELETEANFTGLLGDFEKQVEQMMAQDGAESCNTFAREQLAEVTRAAQRFYCKFEINEDMSAFRKQLEVMVSKVEDLLKEISRDTYKCMRESYFSFNKFAKCMEQNIQNIKQELQIVDKEIQELFNVIEQSTPIFTDKISTCFAQNKEELVNKMQVAEDNIKSCIAGNTVAPAHLKMAGSNVEELVDELKKLIRDTTSRLAKLYSEMKDKIVEIENEFNLNGLVKDFKQQVQQMMAQDGTESCNKLALEQIVEVSKVAVQSYFCKIEVNEDMTKLEKQMEVLGSKVEELLKETGNDVYKCMRESHFSFNKFAQCMEQNVQNIKLEVQVVDKEILELFNIIEQSLPAFSDKLSDCFAQNKVELVNKMQVAEENIKNCISGNNVQ